MNTWTSAPTASGLNSTSRRLRRLLGMVLLGLMGILPLQAQERDDYVYDEASLRTVLADVEDTSGYRFLYRDALISGKRLSFRANGSGVLEALEDALSARGLAMQVDTDRRQVLLYQKPNPHPTHTAVRGYVVCAESGARLPFATISWEEEGQLRGRVANESGAFQMRLADQTEAPSRQITASYVGYEPEEVTLGASAPEEVTIRLHPELDTGAEVVVQSHLLDTELDTTWHSLIEPGLAAPLGEPSVLRALQPLPAVSLSGAFNDGLIVRGSRPDGFQVLLDGAPIYNYSHFFGLFDVFNEEALQTVGFYYGVTPASFQAPPGGTLSFVTRPGSQTGFHQQVGISNTTFQGTAEGPLADGRGSWLLSGRHSYLDQFDWFNNSTIIAHGLGIERFTSLPLDTDIDPEHRILIPGDNGARFYDIHGKLQYEWDGGRRLMANAYVGGDHTGQEARRVFVDDEEERLFRPARSFLEDASIPRQTVDTRKSWGNEAASIHFQQPLPGGLHSRTLAAVSRYFSRYSKDDFVYTRYPESTDRARHFIEPFENYNQLLDLKLEQQVDAPLTNLGTWSAGLTANHYRVQYQEQTAIRPPYSKEQTSAQVDLFGHVELTNLRHATLQAGLRSHYFSSGNFLRLSPRLNLRLFPEQPVSLGIGYSKNHQFLHRLALEHTNTPNVWVLSRSEQPPSRVHQGTAGVYIKPAPNTFFQVEAYVKLYDHLRQHESVVQSADFLSAGSVRLEPWLHDNTAYARGIELMLRQRLGPLLWTTSYALGRVELGNDGHGNGEPFPASWDRRHQFQTHLKGNLGAQWSAHLTWMWTSGTPNNLSFTDLEETAYLPAYHRVDLNMQWRQRIAGLQMEARMGLFNLYDQRNIAYRTPLSILDPDATQPRLTFTNVDVYDLGFQPSFEIVLSF